MLRDNGDDLKKYEDIINLDWPILDSTRVPMNLNQRAKIFLPFAALTGYEQALEKRLREVEKKMNETSGKIQFEQESDFSSFTDSDDDFILDFE